MRRIYALLISLLSTVALGGCIENDIPYPVIKLDILSLEADGLLSAPEIDPGRHSVTLRLEETTDIRAVQIRAVELTEGAESSVAFPGTFDLRTPLYVTLSLYQSVEWTITAEQTIERYFSVDNQIGAAEIDVDSHIATAYVPMDTDLSDIHITQLKLAPKDISTYSPDPSSFTSFEDTVHHIDVSYFDITEMWTLKVVKTEVEVEFTSVDAWARSIWLYASGRSGADLGFRYREQGSEEWIEADGVEADGGRFSARITGLKPESQYEVVAYSDDNLTPVQSVTTEAAPVLENGGMEQWAKIGKSYFPYLEGAPYWGTGNPGATTLGDQFNLTTPLSEPRPGSNGTTSASLQSMYPNMAGIGKFAAGNLFLGRFAQTIGTNGIVHFGRPYEGHPTALHGYVRYHRGDINRVGSSPADRPLQSGDPDNGAIYIAVGDWTAAEYGGDEESPVRIDTRDAGTFFSSASPAVIGYGEWILSESVDEWTEFTIPLKYVSTSRRPTHLIIVCSASRWGDYFTGSTDSRMIIDDLELIYE